jgi:hypothetical protein
VTVDDQLEKLTSTNMLHHKKDLRIILQNLQKLNNIWMPQLFYQLHLSRYIALVPRINDHLFMQDLDGNLTICR